MHTQLRVLVIEDSITIQEMVRKMLQPHSGVGFQVQECGNLTDAEALLRRDTADVVILDLTLPESSGVETVSRVRGLNADIPIVVFTGCEDDNLALAARQLGADDFLVKSEVRKGSLLARTLIDAGENKHARTSMNRYAVEMECLAEARAQQLLHRDRLATIGTMSAGVAHEIRNPLSYIGGNVHALLTSWEDVKPLLETCRTRGLGDEEEIEYILQEVPQMLRDIRSGVDRILEISEGLKSFARKSSMEPEESCLEELIDNSLLLCHNLLKDGITVEKDYGTDRVTLPLLPQRILQVFVNLLTNAAQAMGGEGRITIRTARKDNHLEMEVSDSGPGIDEEVRDRIFEPFFTTKPDGEGTGLGLSICRKIMEEHGGTMDVTSGPDGGACFSMTLPLAPDVPKVGPEDGDLSLAEELALV